MITLIWKFEWKIIFLWLKSFEFLRLKTGHSSTKYNSLKFNFVPSSSIFQSSIKNNFSSLFHKVAQRISKHTGLKQSTKKRETPKISFSLFSIRKRAIISLFIVGRLLDNDFSTHNHKGICLININTMCECQKDCWCMEKSLISYQRVREMVIKNLHT